MTDTNATFHRHTAEELTTRYVGAEGAPEGWRETAAWHWAQAGAYAEAADAALEVAQEHITRLDFTAARRWAERTLELLERLSPVERRLYDLRAYGVALAVLEFGGQYREGLDYARRMLRAAKERNSREAEARALLAMGRMQRDLNQLTVAEATLQQARALAESEEPGDLEAEVRVHLAKVHQLQGHHIEALQELQLAQDEHEQTDDRVKLARVFTGVGDVYRVLGAGREALGFYNRALSLEQGRANLLGQAILNDKIALALLAMGRLPEAETAGQESLQLRKQINDVVGQARSHSVLGAILGNMGQHERAVEHHEQARSLEEQTQNQRGEGMALLHLGDEFRSLRRYEQANSCYHQALVIANGSGDLVAMARTLERQGDLAAEEGYRDSANQAWREALQIRESLGHADEAAALRERLRTGQMPGRL